MQVGCNTANWEALLRQLREEPNEFLFDVEGLLEESPYAPGDAASLNQEVSLVLQEVAESFQDSRGEALAAVVRSFNAVSGSGAPYDAELPKSDGIWYAVMSPQTLKNLVLQADHVDRSALEPAIARVLEAKPQHRVKSPRDCIEYLDAWVQVYRYAAEAGHGVLVSIG